MRAFTFGSTRRTRAVADLVVTLILGMCDPNGARAGTGCQPLPGSDWRREPRSSLPVLFTSQDSIQLVEVGQLPGALDFELAFGDTDHDGRGEVVRFNKDPSGLFHYYLHEHQGSNGYSLELTGDFLVPYAIGDLDRDGKAELIGQHGQWIRVYESLDASSYPTNLVWSSPSLSNVVGYTTVGDTDLDGQMEVIHSANGLGGGTALLIFENRGDNMFDEVLNLPLSGGASGEKAIGDLDRDGVPEIAFSGQGGVINVVESTGNDTWNLKWTVATTLRGAYAAEIGADMDLNGLPELFVMGTTQGWRTFVYEAAGEEQFTQVAALIQQDGYSGFTANTIGSLTASGHQEYMMQGFCCAWIYSASGPGAWQLIGAVPNESRAGLFAIDLNENGRDEVFWVGETTILILEQAGPVSDAGEHRAVSPRLHAFPNPMSASTEVRLPSLIDRSNVDRHRLSIYDVEGRLRDRRPLSDLRTFTWRPSGFAAGVYVLQVEMHNGTPIATGRVTLVR